MIDFFIHNANYFIVAGIIYPIVSLMFGAIYFLRISDISRFRRSLGVILSAFIVVPLLCTPEIVNIYYNVEPYDEQAIFPTFVFLYTVAIQAIALGTLFFLKYKKKV